MFDHGKRLKDQMTMICHMYDSKYDKVLMIACCDIRSKNGATQKLL